MPIVLADDPVFEAIQNYLGTVESPAEWDQAEARLLYENDGTGVPDSPDSFVRIILDTELYDQQSIGGGEGPGDNRWDERGTLWFHVFTPRGIGPQPARRIAKGLANAFRGKQMLDDRLTFGGADMGAGDPGQEDANYYLLSVSLDWELTEAQ